MSENINMNDGHWHLDRRVPISLIFALLVQTATVVWFIAMLSARVDHLETSSSKKSGFERRIIILEVTAKSTVESLHRIERILDRKYSQKSKTDKFQIR